MVVWGAQFTWFIRGQATMALGVNRWLPFCVVPLSGALLFLHGLAFLLQDLFPSREP